MALRNTGLEEIALSSDIHQMIQDLPDLQITCEDGEFDLVPVVPVEDRSPVSGVSTPSPSSSFLGSSSTHDARDLIDKLDLDSKGAGMLLAKELTSKFPSLKKACNYYVKHMKMIPESIFIEEISTLEENGMLFKDPGILEHTLKVMVAMTSHHNAMHVERYKSMLENHMKDLELFVPAKDSVIEQLTLDKNMLLKQMQMMNDKLKELEKLNILVDFSQNMPKPRQSPTKDPEPHKRIVSSDSFSIGDAEVFFKEGIWRVRTINLTPDDKETMKEIWPLFKTDIPSMRKLQSFTIPQIQLALDIAGPDKRSILEELND